MPVSQNSLEKKYWAFISYSSKDKKWGKWLHHRLENYPIPREFQDTELFDGAILGKNLSPIFRDRDELAGSAELGPAILKGLQQSRFLIVLCSPNSAKSKWVNKEIEDFVALDPGNHRRILALILDGEPNATSNPRANHARECFPPALRPPVEPLAGDLRKDGDGKERGFLKILSGIAQLDFDALYRRHERAQKRKRLTLAALASLLILSLTALTTFAYQQKSDAQTARTKAERSARLEREAAERSERDLYFAMIPIAHAAAQADSPLDAMTALARCPPRHRSWEWSLLSKLVGFAPIVLHPADVDLLDTGILQGSGLREGVNQLLTNDQIQPGSGGGSLPDGDQASSIRTIVTLPDRTGGELFITRSNSVIPLAQYRIASFGQVYGTWISKDQSVVAILSTRLSTPLHSLGSTPQAGEEDRWLHIVPVPPELHFIPEDDGERGDDDEDKEKRNAPSLHAFPNGLLTAEFWEAPLLCAFPSENPDRPLGVHRFDIPERIYENTMAYQVLQHLDSEPGGAGKARKDTVDGPAILAINWSQPDLPFLTFDSDSGFLLGSLHKPGETHLLGYPDGFGPDDLTDPSNPYPAAAFSTDGSRIALWAAGFNQIPIYRTADASFEKFLALAPFPDSLSDAPGAAWLRFSPRGDSVTLTKEHRNSLRIEIADYHTAKSVLSHPDHHYRAVDWTSEEDLFAIYNEEEEVIRLGKWPEQTVLKTLQWKTERYGSIDLIRDLPKHRRILVGNTLLTSDTLREILRLPDAWELAPDGDWVAIPGTRHGPTYLDGRYLNYDQASVQIVRNINTDSLTTTNLASRIRQFQLEALTTD